MTDRPARILVVDDEPAATELLVTLLRRVRPGDAIDGVGSAEEALARLDAEPFDLLVVDLGLPGMDGAELIRETKRRRPETAVVVVTARREPEAVSAAFAAGAADLLHKPVRLDDVRRSVADALARQELLGAEGEGEFRIDRRLEGWVELTASSHREYVERFRLFTERLYGTALDENTKYQLRMALDELGTNAVEWGNREDPDKKVRISYVFFEDQIVLKIEDEGSGFDVSTLQDPTEDPLLHQQERAAAGKREGGFGIFMVRQVMDRVLFNDAGNTVILTKFLPGPPPVSSGTAS